MNISEIFERKYPPEPWEEGEKIPWDNTDFSERMLAEHLSQEHDAASRPASIIDEQVNWLHSSILEQDLTKVLDLCCGPGLYTSHLARLGHLCVGIDYAPAAIAFAKRTADSQGLACKYIEGDIRSTDYTTSNFGLAMIIHGELNVFRPEEIEVIVQRCLTALRPGGSFIAEAHTLPAIKAIGEARSTWYSSQSGLFSPQPHLSLKEAFWHADRQVATERYIIVETKSGRVTRYGASLQAYSENEYVDLLSRNGFSDIRIETSLSGEPSNADSPYIVLWGKKPSD